LPQPREDTAARDTTPLIQSRC